jgi:hypothetical protein
MSQVADNISSTRNARSFRVIICVIIFFAFSVSLGFSRVPPTSAPAPSSITQRDYFHSGAGAYYLRRAAGELITQTLRGNISVLIGSGANIMVLSGQQGKFLVDSGARGPQLQPTLSSFAPLLRSTC